MTPTGIGTLSYSIGLDSCNYLLYLIQDAIKTEGKPTMVLSTESASPRRLSCVHVNSPDQIGCSILESSGSGLL